MIPLVDHLAPSAAAIESVNTVVNDNGVLTAHNTDYSAVVELLRIHDVFPALRTVVRGSGGMAKAVVAALWDSGFGDVVVVAHNETAGRELAEAYGFEWAAEARDGAELLVNVTPIGMAGGTEADLLPFTPEQVAAAQVVFDVVATPVQTPLIGAARNAGKRVLTGADVANVAGRGAVRSIHRRDAHPGADSRGPRIHAGKHTNRLASADATRELRARRLRPLNRVNDRETTAHTLTVRRGRKAETHRRCV